MKERIEKAIEVAIRFGGIEGDHHKTWVIDQMIRELTGCPVLRKKAEDVNGITYTYNALGESQEYLKFVTEAKKGKDGWEIGIAP